MVAYSFKKRFVAPIQTGLGLIPIEPKIVDDPSTPSGFALASKIEPKRQTIRAIGKRRHARPGETLQLYTAMRTKQCTKIGEARCIETGKIEINFGDETIELRSMTNVTLAFLNDLAALDAFARQDGFLDWNEMLVFWGEEHGLGRFRGVLIKWEPIQ